MIKKDKKPSIRFKEFTDDWEQHKLEEEAIEIVAGGDVNKDLLCEEGIYPVVANSLTNNGIVGYYNEEYRIKAPAVTVTGRGDVGHAKARKVDFTPIVRLISIKSNHDVDFLENAINTLRIIIESTGVPQLTVPQLGKYELYFPQNIKEEQAIGKFFLSIDNLITLHHRKYDKLINIKKAMLEKMFPKDGSNVPKIRFKGFDDDWKQCKLHDIVDIVGGGTPSTSNPEYWDGEIDWYSPTEIGEKVYAEGSIKRITELGLQKSSAKVLPANKTILFTSRASIGDMAILKRSGATNQGFQSLIVKDKNNPYFVYSMGHLIKQYALKNASGSTFLEISGKQLGAMDILIPDENEQNQISEFFKQLDNYITLHKLELENLKNIKKACLDKMFL